MGERHRHREALSVRWVSREVDGDGSVRVRVRVVEVEVIANLPGINF
jgi:hypothetical protein